MKKKDRIYVFNCISKDIIENRNSFMHRDIDNNHKVFMENIL